MIPVPPPWLPGTVSVGGNWGAVLKMLYRIFEHDFKHGACDFQGRAVWWNRSKEEGESYEEGFWHLITKLDQKQNIRLFDPRRAERLPWCVPTIVNSFRPEVRVWDYRETRRTIRTYLWLRDWDYVVILEKRTLSSGIDAAYLITAYHVGGGSTRATLQRKYDARVE